MSTKTIKLSSLLSALEGRGVPFEVLSTSDNSAHFSFKHVHFGVDVLESGSVKVWTRMQEKTYRAANKFDKALELIEYIASALSYTVGINYFKKMFDKRFLCCKVWTVTTNQRNERP